MKRRKKKISALNVVSSLIIGIALITAGYIMANHLGLIDSLDFGAGAYYYADIPEFAKLVNGDHYTSGTSMGILIALFLIWGAVMYRLWTWLDRKLQ